MRLMLLYPVCLILFASISLATPPAGYVKPPNDDKDPPSYQYKYEIGDVDSKEIQGKMETRLGELASGRYYVNDEKSSTDVKYYADEWGYHPLVKYRATNDHSVATTHFALGEHVVKSLLNGSEVGEEVKLPPVKGHQDQLRRKPLHRRRLVQLVQPYTSLSGEIASDTISNVVSSSIHETQSIDDTSDVNSSSNYNNERTSVRGTNFHDDATPSMTGFNDNFNNYVTLPRSIPRLIEETERSTSREHRRPGQHDYTVSFAGTTAMPEHRSILPTNIYPTKPSTLSPLSGAEVNSNDENNLSAHEASNNLYSTISDDVLLIQNAGSFGRRLKPTGASLIREMSTGTKTQRKFASGTTQSPYDISTSKPILHVSETTNAIVEHGASSHGSYSTSTTTPRSTSPLYSTFILNDMPYSTVTAIPDFHAVHSVVGSEVSSNDYKSTLSEIRYRDNGVSGAYAPIFARIYPNGERDRGIGERVNSLLSGNSPLFTYEGDAYNDSSIVKTERITSPGLLANGKRLEHQLYVTLRQTLDTELRDSPNVHSSTPMTLSTFNSKPIIVAELANYEAEKAPEYSTTFPCNKEEQESSTLSPSISSTFSETLEPVLVTPKLHSSRSHITTSSVILNPIQAGVSLVNAGETELIARENHEDGSPASAKERLENENEMVAIKNVSSGDGNELGKIVRGETSAELYETINPAFGQSTFSQREIGKSIGTIETTSSSTSNFAPLDGNAEDQQIEIQKSVEIYQNAPVHEIHYPPQVIRQVSGISHGDEQGVNMQRPHAAGLLHQRYETKDTGEMRSGYRELQNAVNVKQFHGPRQGYNGETEVKHESDDGQLSFENIRDAALNGASVYLGNLVRQDNELVDYSIERNNDHPGLLTGHENGPGIIKLIRDSIPEVKYTAAKTPRINLKVYPTFVQAGDNGKFNEKQHGTADMGEQREKVKTSGEDRNMMAHSQLQRILSESGSVQRYFNGVEWTKLREQEQRQQQSQQQTLRSQEDHGNYRVHENIDETRLQQPQQQQQSIVLPWNQSYDTSSVNNLHGNLVNTVEDTSTMSQALQQAPIPIVPMHERIVEKTIHVPQPYPVEVPRIIEKKVPYPVEKIVERKVPYPVEKIIEKKVPVPQPYPVHIPVDRIVEKQVQILQPYPVHIEKIIEKKVPYPVQRLVPQPYPVHIPYPIEKIIEKPVHIPVTIEKIVEKKVHVPQPYPVQVPIKVPYPVEITKYLEQSVQVPYGVRYGVSYQQIMKPQSSNGLYGSQGSVSIPLYGLSLVNNQNRDRQRPNVTQEFHGYNYDKPVVPFVSGRSEGNNGADQQTSNGWEQFSYGKSSSFDNHQRHQAFAKKSHGNHVSKLPSLNHPLYNYSVLTRRHASYRQSNGPVGEQSIATDEYIGPVPASKQKVQHQIVRSRSSSDQQQQSLLKQQHSTSVTRSPGSPTLTTSSRRARQQDNSPHYQTGPGAFRQSKIEYGFKPPMIPSVQYDEKTAAKVEN